MMRGLFSSSSDTRAASHSEAAEPVPAIPDPYAPNTGDAGFEVSHYDLDLDYRLAANRLAGTAVLTVVPTVQLKELTLDLVGLDVRRVSIDGTRIKSVQHRRGRLRITSPAPLPADVPVTLMVRYEGNPSPARGTWGEVGWEELDDGALVAGQPTGAATWFPCNDHPSRKSTYRIAVVTDAGYRVVANGRLAFTERRSSRTRWVYEQDQPISTYQVTVQIGRYEAFDISVPGTPVNLYVPRPVLAAARPTVGRSGQMLQTYTELFGPYPFDVYSAVVTEDPLEIPLEAGSLSVFGSNHVHDQWQDERLIAHELSHQWFGNSVTARQWRDIWLHEGFACYSEWLWSEFSNQAPAAVLARAAHTGLRRLPQDLIIADPGAEDMFDDRLYKRGALALHALRTHVGDDAFFAILREWAAEHRHGLVDTTDFLAHVEASTGSVDAANMLVPWLFEAPLPPLP